MHSSTAPNSLHINPNILTHLFWYGRPRSLLPNPMETTVKIIRTSIHTFLKSYNYFTVAAIFALPFSFSILLSSTLLPDFLSFHPHLQSLFNAAGFPQESEFCSILTLKLSQTISSSILVLPFSLSSLLLAKTFIIQSVNIVDRSSFTGIFNSILQTQLWNTLVIISANATCFWVLFIAFNFLEKLHIPSLFLTIVSGIAYSVVIANTLITCNMALILSGMELRGGIMSILKSCVLIRGRTSIALSLSLPVNMVLAGIEFLFQFRIIKAYSDSGIYKPASSMVLEGLLIAYMYSVLIIIDVIVGCVFFKSCKIAYDRNIIDQESGKSNAEDDDVLHW